MAVGSTTLRREELDRGLEPDEGFYLGDLERIRDLDQIDLDVDPPPDLAIEIEISRSALIASVCTARSVFPSCGDLMDRRSGY